MLASGHKNHVSYCSLCFCCFALLDVQLTDPGTASIELIPARSIGEQADAVWHVELYIRRRWELVNHAVVEHQWGECGLLVR